jgi:HTH-type transcriptional regulator/antitoxin HipB
MLARNAIDIGLIMRERRRKLGLDQGELARRIKVSRQWVVEVEKGKPRAEIGLILRTLEALGLRIWIDTGEKAVAGAAEVIPSVDLDELLDDIMRDDFRIDSPGKKPS